jgi:hypothetical protein
METVKQAQPLKIFGLLQDFCDYGEIKVSKKAIDDNDGIAPIDSINIRLDHPFKMPIENFSMMEKRAFEYGSHLEVEFLPDEPCVIFRFFLFQE